jgi:uridine kinase
MSANTQIIAIAGGSGSGKTTLAKKVLAHFAREGCAILGQDSYYIDQSHRFDRDGGSVNFDHPSALEFTLLAKHIQELKSGRDIEIPIYDFATHKRSAKTQRLKHHPVILVDGTLILSQEILLPLFDESVFLEVDEDTRFQRRLKRDVEQRGRTPEGVRDQFFKQVKLMHDEFVEPSKAASSVLIRNGKPVIQRACTKGDAGIQKRLLELFSR